MVIVSVSSATSTNGVVKKGYKKVIAKNGRVMYLTDNTTTTKVKKETKKPINKVKKGIKNIEEGIKLDVPSL